VSAGDNVTLGDQEAASDYIIGRIEDANDGWFKLLAHSARVILLSWFLLPPKRRKEFSRARMVFEN
jgi:hypothetical protein